jgi:hypothetical protein
VEYPCAATVLFTVTTLDTVLALFTNLVVCAVAVEVVGCRHSSGEEI